MRIFILSITLFWACSILTSEEGRFRDQPRVCSRTQLLLNRRNKAKLSKKYGFFTHNHLSIAARMKPISPKNAHPTETLNTRDSAMTNESSDIYKPLEPNRNEIRVLRLKPRQYNHDIQQDEQRIICFLEHMILDDAVEYMALSYVWENGFNPQEIFLSGNERSISANLVDALRQLRSDSDDIILWADQLCINQDDYAEKASQIQKMGSIYKRAGRVISWLGVSANESDLVFTTLRQIDMHHTISLKTSILSDIAREMEQTTSSSHDRIWDETKVLDTLRTALTAFTTRSYWRRLWVLQEFVLATNVLIMCGSETITDISLRNAWEILGETANTPDVIARPQSSKTMDLIAIAESWRCDSLWWDAWLGIVRFTSQRDDYHSHLLHQDLHYTIDHDLFTIMYETLTTFSSQIRLSCSDPRDRVFSLLGLATDFHKFGHFPDYTTSTESIYEELARNFIQQGHVDSFSFCQDNPTFRARNMASWAVDWSLKIRIPPWGKLSIDASQDWSVDLAASVLDSKTIVISGTCVGTIQSHGSQWSHSGPITPHQMQTFLHHLRAFCDRSNLIRANNRESVCAEMAAPAASAYLRDKQLLLMQYREVFKRLEELTNLPDECYPELDVQHSSIYERELWRQFQTCPFITDNGYIGIAPPYIQEGDCISSFPEVVHRTFSGKNWKATISVLLAQHMSMVL